MSGSDFYDGRRAAAEYEYSAAAPLHNHSYLVPGIIKLLGPGGGRRLLDLGCGNGTLTSRLHQAGFQVVGVDSSASGVEQAKLAFPHLQFERHDLDRPLPTHLAGFDVVLAAEVIEHLFLPRGLFTRANEGLAPHGQLLVTTPFHGYWKNLALSVCGGWDRHLRPGWDFGHIKFFSRRTLSELAKECGYAPRAWRLVGRVPQLAKSMIMLADRRS